VLGDEVPEIARVPATLSWRRAATTDAAFEGLNEREQL
jgi:hypothetical protein